LSFYKLISFKTPHFFSSYYNNIIIIKIMQEFKNYFQNYLIFLKEYFYGSWKQTGLNGDIEITPKKSGYTFSPSSFHLSQLDENKDNILFTANSNGTDSGDDSDNSGGDDGSDENSDDSDGTEDNLFVLSGKIKNESGESISDVIIHFNSGEFSSVTTAEDGSWEKEELTGRVEVNAEKYGYTFEPPTRSLETSDENVNFTAIGEASFTASGRVTNEENIPIPDVVINFNNGTFVNTDYNGNWEKTGLTGEVVVTPELDDWQFRPANITVDDANNVANFTAQPADNYEYYTLSGVVEDNDGANIHIEIRRASDNTLIANAITNDEGNWTSTSVWGTVIVTPQITGAITGFTPPNQSFSGPETEVNFRADY